MNCPGCGELMRPCECREFSRKHRLCDNTACGIAGVMERKEEVAWSTK